MENQIQVFQNNKFGKIRTIVSGDKVYFNLKDVCEILELKNARDVKKRLRDDDVIFSDAMDPNGKKRKMNFIGESNLYKCIFRSNKLEAEEFTEWVTGEVLPTLRKRGMYMHDNIYKNLLNDPEKLGEILINYGKEKEKVDVLESEIEDKEGKIKEMQPKVAYCDNILACRDLVSISIIAKDYGWSAREMNQRLKMMGIQYNQGGTWMLYQKYASYGYTQTRTTLITHENGISETRPHMYWTQKGRLFLYDFFKNIGILPVVEWERSIT